MQYDPVKKSLGKVFNSSPQTRILFYKLLDLLLLRSWHIHKALRKWNRELKNKKADILDAGSGFGQYSYYLSTMNSLVNILAVDVKEEQIADCNAFFKKIGKKNIRFEYADLTIFKKESSFDLVVCVDVMEHILEDVAVFKNFYTSMKPGAMLLISTPSDQGGSDVKEGEDHSFIEEHVRDGYNKQEITDKLISAGFSKIEVKYSYGMPGKISWKLSMKWPLQLLNISKLFFLILPVYYLTTFPFCIILNLLDTHTKHTTGTGLIVKAWK